MVTNDQDKPLWFNIVDLFLLEVLLLLLAELYLLARWLLKLIIRL